MLLRLSNEIYIIIIIFFFFNFISSFRLISEEISAILPPLRIPRLRHHRVTDWDPYFENAEGQGINGSQNVALHLGATALLDCRVAMLAGRKVSN